MNKCELINRLGAEAGLTHKESIIFVDLFFDAMARALARGNRVEIRGLCSFFIKRYGAYIGRNPKTGEKVKVNSKQLPFFKPGLELKKRVDK